ISISGHASPYTLCAGLNADINFSGGPANGSLTYTLNGGSNQSLSLNGSGFATFNTGTLIDTLVYKLVSVSNTSCSSPTVDSVVLNVGPDTWLGIADTVWSNPSNWCGGVPTATTPILVPAGTPYTPNVPGAVTITAQNLSVDTGAAITLSAGSSLQVSGDLTLSGNIGGGGEVVLNGTTPQNIGGTGSVGNLTVSNTSTITVDTTGGDSLKVTGVVTLNAGTLVTNNSFVLVSGPGGTGSIGTMNGGSISGDVQIQRYVPGGRRCYRFFAHPYQTAVALNPELTKDVDITGAGGSANGFTTTATNNPSAYWYDPMRGGTYAPNGNDLGWRAFTSALVSTTNDSNSWNKYEAIRVLVRGPKGFGLTSTPIPTPVTFQTSGNVNTGTQVIHMVKGPFSNSNVLGNPYPSSVNLRPIMYAASQSGQVSGGAYWVWDAEQGTLGGYNTQAISNDPADDYYLPIHGAFVVSAAATGDSLIFNESDKVATDDNMAFRTNSSVPGRVEFRVYSNNDSIYWDRMYTVFNGQASAAKDNMDGDKATNPSLNFYSKSSDNKKLSVDVRPFVNNMMIPLGITVPTAQQYKIKVHSMDLPSNYSLYLMDNYLNVVQPLAPGTEYTFNVLSTDSLSQGEGRFQLNGTISTTGISPTPTTTTTSGTHFSVNISPNPATDMTNISFEGAEKGSTAQIAISNVSGQEVYSVNVKDVSSAKVSVPLQNLSAGIYMVRITCGTETITKQLVKK
ncbi:MAG: T9SS type A sorting domain-containing protein, partial [Bacteroidota bacterium]